MSLTYPDTILILNISQQGIADVDRQLSGLSPVTPNPFVGTATATLALAEAERVTFDVVRVNGQRIVTKNLDLPAGSHQIGLSLAETQVAFLVVKTPTQRYVAKLANKGNGGGNDIRLLGSTEIGSQNKAIAEGDFQVGDMMRYVGLSSDGTSAAVTKAQQANELITLIFNEDAPIVNLPTITSGPVSEITANSAISGGNVIDDGGATVTERGVCWNTNRNPTVSDSYTTDGSGTGNFTSNITGLSANTTYYVRAYATNSKGTAYGVQSMFTTGGVPTVSTSTVSSIASSYAICGGNVTADGRATVTGRGVCWSTSHNPTVSDRYTTDGSGNGSFTSNITGLTANTTYYVRAYATNSYGTAYGEEKTFTTEEERFDAIGASIAIFSVSSTKIVKFSKGNLQYQASTGTWRFAENQYDYIGNGNVNISSSYNGWIDLFGWGTSGWNVAANAYQPWSTSTTPSDYYLGGVYDNSCVGPYANADWGVYNAISNGGNQAGMWRTLTYEEWVYLMYNRSVAYRYVKATVNGVVGMIVFPDSFTLPTSVTITGHNSAGTSYTTNVYGLDAWTSLLNAGCIFLPAAGYRNGTSVYELQNYRAGHYWSSSAEYTSAAWCMSFSSGDMSVSSQTRSYGQSVRLVHDCSAGEVGLPTVTTASVTNITVTSALCGGNVSDGDNVTARGVCWGTGHNPTVSGSHTTDGSGTGSFTSSITGLSANTTYYVRAYATNSQGTAYGAERSFTTEETVSLATVTTSTVSNITTNTATCGGNVSDDGNATVTARGVCWGTGHNPTVSGSHTTDGSGTGSFTSSITGLTPNTTYYVRAYATNSQGTAYGAERSFTTEEESVAGGFDANGASNALFSVSATKQVRFSKGNLQYQASTGTWRFAESQYDYIGTWNEYISSMNNRWIDLFGWGTSGWNSGASDYQPWSTSTTNSYYYPGGSYTNSLTGTYANADWGVYNAISNGGNQAGMWRTLTKDEWNYLLFTRSATYRYVKATVNGKAGMIVFPDSFTLPSSVAVTGYNRTGTSYTANVYSLDQWTALQNAGCIFLPVAGYRHGTNVSSVGSNGYYWSSTYGNESYAWLMHCGSAAVVNNYRSYGFSVRLVQDN